MAKINFNVDAYTARLIGRENVSKLNGAILELVKNTYDADASVCVIYYDDDSEALYIADNGFGMTQDIIKKHWMTIGRSTKKNTYTSKSGRVQTGAKGIGRFALDRIADQCSMLTRSDEGGALWSVDWRDFDKESAITDISADLENSTIKFREFVDDIPNYICKELISGKFDKSGTIFKLQLLRDSWNTKRIENIKNELMTLIPHELSNIFNIYLFDNSTATLEDAMVLHGNDFFTYDYKIDFSVIENGETRIEIIRNEFDFRDNFEYVLQEGGFSEADRSYFNCNPIRIDTNLSEIVSKNNGFVQNTIGAFNGTLYFGKLQVPASEKKRFYYKDTDIRMDFVGTFAGIRIYRDKFRVRPYGESNTSNFDWLQLSSRKNKSPAAISHPTGAWRVRGDQMLGSLHISRANIMLPDQANREGIVETPEFALLKSFLTNIIQFFERDRQYVFRKLSDLYEKETEIERIRKEIEEKSSAQEKKSSKENHQETLFPQNEYMIEVSKAQKVLSEREEKIKNLEDENVMLRILATTGITTNSYIHEFKAHTHKLNMKIVMAKEAIEFDRDQDEALKQISAADEIRESFISWFRVTVESVRKDKRTQKVLNCGQFIQELASAWQQILDEKNIYITLHLPDDEIKLRCFPYEMDIIVNNLITNSVTSLCEANSEEKRIDISLSKKENSIILDYSDNGPGLPAAYKSDPKIILESFESSRVDENGDVIGTGMGMWLIKRTVLEHNGTIDLTRNTKECNGFYCRIIFPNTIKNN